MREIKFRAWDKKFKRMITPCEDDEYLVSFRGDIWSECDGDASQRSDDYILMQFTGLHDKNGREIYEGDILTVDIVEAKFTPLFIVVYEEYDTAFSAFDVINKVWVKLNALKYEVIGNIHANPQLLRGMK